jgi:hypothetical protein
MEDGWAEEVGVFFIRTMGKEGEKASMKIRDAN